MGNAYTLQEVAELLGLSVAEVRRCVRAGFLSIADEKGHFSFQDLVALRRAAALVSARVAPHRVRRAFQRLRQQLPQAQPLSSVQVSVEGSSIVARGGASVWNPISGQLHLDFERPRAPAIATPTVDVRNVAEAHYVEGCELEERSAPGADGAYRRALDVLPEHDGARINLGRLLHAAGQLDEAVSHYQSVLTRGPSAVASFNLAVVLEDLGQFDDAVRAYQRALAADPDCEDAYFNLARLYERQGERIAALRALKAYRHLTRPR